MESSSDLHGTAVEETLPTGDERPEGLEPEVGRGAAIGRYVVLARVGAGAMGVVYSAYDPELDRKVALKLLKPRGGDQANDRTRLQREAQAMAKLAHPNVVTIFDVGLHEARVFLAMEYVPGQSLAQWVRQRDRSWRPVVSALIQAGRGLAAAHEQGLVHRDFKPENVRIDPKGRVRVLDFGLARAGDDEDEPPLERSVDDLRSISQDALSTPLTHTGAVMGTPAYMSPEQFIGAPAGPPSDQFSFCITLYECLYGERPFAGENFAEIGIAVSEGEVRPAPRGADVPAWLRRVLLRGLSGLPDARWPSMRALLDALERGARPPARRGWIVGGAVAMASVVALAWGRDDDARHVADVPCQGFERHLDGMWDEPVRDAVRTALGASEARYADATAQRVVAEIDAYTSAWIDHRRAICEATRVRGEQSEALMDRRMACMDRRLIDARMLVTVLTDGDPAVVEHASEAAAGLGGFEACDDVEGLAPDEPDLAAQPTAVAERAQIEAEVARAVALRRAGQFAEAMDVAERAAARAATDTGQDAGARVRVEATLTVGILQAILARHEDARATLEACYFLALESGELDLAARAAVRLVDVVGFELVHAEAGEQWSKHAAALLIEHGDDLLRAELEIVLARMDHRAEAIDESLTHAKRALQLREARLGPDHHLVAEALSSVARALDQSDPTRARPLLERALSIWEERLGPDHPRLASTLNGLGIVAANTLRWDDAEAYYTRAMRLKVAQLGPEHAVLGIYENNLGELFADQERYDEAIEHLRRAYEIRVAALGPDHAATIYSLEMWGTHQAKAGEYVEGIAKIRRSLQQRIDGGQGRRRVASGWWALGEALYAAPADAGGSRRKGLLWMNQAWEAHVGQGPTHPNVKLLRAWYRSHGLEPPD